MKSSNLAVVVAMLATAVHGVTTVSGDDLAGAVDVIKTAAQEGGVASVPLPYILYDDKGIVQSGLGPDIKVKVDYWLTDACASASGRDLTKIIPPRPRKDDETYCLNMYKGDCSKLEVGKTQRPISSGGNEFETLPENTKAVIVQKIPCD